jgi:hypothetical protein
MNSNAVKGVAMLPLVILIGGLIVEIGIAGAFMAYFLNQSSFGIRLSDEALSASQTGILDAEIKIVRDKNFNPSPNTYTLNVGNRSVQVTVCKNFKTVSSPCDTAMNGKYEITSLGIALTRRRQLRAIIQVNDLTGGVRLESEREIGL